MTTKRMGDGVGCVGGGRRGREGGGGKGEYSRQRSIREK